MLPFTLNFIEGSFFLPFILQVHALRIDPSDEANQEIEVPSMLDIESLTQQDWSKLTKQWDIDSSYEEHWSVVFFVMAFIHKSEALRRNRKQ